MRRHFLTVSMIALLSTQAFASLIDEAKEQANLKTGQDKLIKLLVDHSHDYTFDIDEEQTAESIKNSVLAFHQNEERREEPIDPSKIKLEAQIQIRNNFDGAKNSNRKFNRNSYYLTKNRHDDLCVGSVYNVLVYATKRQNRDRNDSFLPISYKGHPLGKPLYDEIRSYAQTKSLPKDKEDRLYKYLEPLFQIVKEEVRAIVEGDTDKGIKSIKDRPRWVFNKSWQGMLDSIKSQTDHHLYMIKYANVSGLGVYPDAEVKDGLTQTLLGKALSLLPNPNKEIYVNGSGQKYYLGFNSRNHLSLIHPDTNLPYPIFSDQRPLGDMNLIHNFEDTPALRKQWKRVGDCIKMDQTLSSQEKTKLSILLEPVGSLFHEYLQNFHVSRDDYPERRRAEDEIIELAHIFSQGHHIPMPFLDMFYQGRVNIHEVLSDLRRINSTHLYLTGDLFPQRLSDRKEYLADDILNYLVFKDIIDRFDEFYRYAGSRLERLNNALEL